ncbi:GNAT family N-acetyltransferase [Bacillus canaveralius]|uniref:GNAT family N-acetyltransferase n=1 Tax=Bacillus canaveralius TaxID=1403243 RepID=UPI000F775B1E|nr:GNAT family N-acetyltransferase [Bacillus canaveralius]RSK55178.1 GNAT family N-acetyltransferase [Bacillus canaveralius]
MEIRELEYEDIPAYLELLKELDKDETMSINEARQLFVKIKSYPFYKVYKAANDAGVFTGTFTLIVCENFGHGGLKFAIAENVVVHPEFKRMGIGKAMMAKALEIAAKHGCYKLMLSSNEKRTEAHFFYDDLGFERHGISFRTELNTK